MRFQRDRWRKLSQGSEEREHIEPFDYDDNYSIAPSQHEITVIADDKSRQHASAKLANPLAGISHSKLEQMGRDYARKHELGDEEDIRAFERGACLAQDPKAFHMVEGLTKQEMALLEKEYVHRWSQPKLLYIVIVVCSLCAAVQGMDETVVNGAQLFYRTQFGIAEENLRSTWLTGLLNSAPYLCSAFIGCWLTTPFNHYFGRRGTVFLTCVFSALACFWQAFASTWWHMFVARFFLGFGIGPKSATVPIYAAESTPPAIRGALTMQWQMWTAFGIMVGYLFDLALYKVPDSAGIVGLNWRIMMASAMLPAVIVVLFVFACPESPRWYMSKNRHYKAYQAMIRLRFSKVQAARDVFYMHVFLEAEAEIKKKSGNPFLELVRVPRNRRALVASEITMFMQQFCGVNVIAYYSSEIFLKGGFSAMAALSASLGFGIINWLFAIPAVYTIDTFGRRNLLLTTFPLMAICLFFTGFSFFISDTHLHTLRTIFIALGIYLFGAVYSPGEGPVPYTYAAESFPLYLRTYGMSVATATTWFFNFVLSITWPSLEHAFTTAGAFSFYGGWNIVGFVLVLFLLPETKGKTLEELDQTFSVPTRVHAKYGGRQFVYFVKRFVLGRKGCEAPKVPEAGDERQGKGFKDLRRDTP